MRGREYNLWKEAERTMSSEVIDIQDKAQFNHFGGAINIWYRWFLVDVGTYSRYCSLPSHDARLLGGVLAGMHNEHSSFLARQQKSLHRGRH